MSDVPTQMKPTPARRRQGRNNGRPGGQKAYASENDVASIDVSHQNRTPQTPSKMGSTPPAPNPAATQGSQAGSHKQRQKNRPKMKNVPNSPEFARPGRQTPPERSIPIRHGPSTAFAGATFHASPAPSALPIPSFVSRPSSDSPVSGNHHNFVQEPSPPATDTDAPTPFRPSSAPRPHESPLDFMFRAHRQEKENERQHGETSSTPTASIPGRTVSSPPLQPRFDPNDPPRAATLPQSRRFYAKQPSSGMDNFEMDGTPGRPVGPAFSTPYQDRIKAARTTGARASSNHGAAEQSHNPASEDPTAALKNFLFGGTNSSAPVPSSSMAASAPTTSGNVDMPTGQSQNAGNGRANNIQAMEDDLRRILKLDLATDGSSPGNRFFSR